MSCRRVKRRLPLMVGRDLPSSQMRAVEKHLAKCHRCRQEYVALKLSVGKIKVWLSAEAADWSDVEWQAVIQRARESRQKSEGRQLSVPYLAPWPFRKGWAYALMAGAALILSWFIWGPSLLMRETAFRAEVPPHRKAPMLLVVQQEIPQDIVSMTLVSKETGLKINWFFNKNFEWEEKK